MYSAHDRVIRNRDSLLAGRRSHIQPQGFFAPNTQLLYGFFVFDIPHEIVLDGHSFVDGVFELRPLLDYLFDFKRGKHAFLLKVFEFGDSLFQLVMDVVSHSFKISKRRNMRRINTKAAKIAKNKLIVAYVGKYLLVAREKLECAAVFPVRILDFCFAGDKMCVLGIGLIWIFDVEQLELSVLEKPIQFTADQAVAKPASSTCRLHAHGGLICLVKMHNNTCSITMIELSGVAQCVNISHDAPFVAFDSICEIDQICPRLYMCLGGSTTFEPMLLVTTESKLFSWKQSTNELVQVYDTLV